MYAALLECLGSRTYPRGFFLDNYATVDRWLRGIVRAPNPDAQMSKDEFRKRKRPQRKPGPCHLVINKNLDQVHDDSPRSGGLTAPVAVLTPKEVALSKTLFNTWLMPNAAKSNRARVKSLDLRGRERMTAAVPAGLPSPVSHSTSVLVVAPRGFANFS